MKVFTQKPAEESGCGGDEIMLLCVNHGLLRCGH